MRLLLFLLLTISIFYACRDQIKSPLDDGKTIAVVRDVMILEAYLKQSADLKLRDSLADYYYQELYDYHGIDSLTYTQLVNMLQNHPEKSKEIMESVLDSLNKTEVR